MSVLFPSPACVTVEQQVTADPVPAVIASLCGYSSHLHLLPEVHLEPGLLVSHHWRPTSCTWRRAENTGRGSDTCTLSTSLDVYVRGLYVKGFKAKFHSSSHSESSCFCGIQPIHFMRCICSMFKVPMKSPMLFIHWQLYFTWKA